MRSSQIMKDRWFHAYSVPAICRRYSKYRLPTYFLILFCLSDADISVREGTPIYIVAIRGFHSKVSGGRYTSRRGNWRLEQPRFGVSGRCCGYFFILGGLGLGERERGEKNGMKGVVGG